MCSNILIRKYLIDGVKALRSCSNFEDIYLDPCENPQCKFIVVILHLYSVINNVEYF